MSHSEVKQYSTADNTFMALAFVPADPEDEKTRDELKNVVFAELAKIPEIRSVTDQLENFEYTYKFALKPEKVRSLETAAGIIEEIKSSFASSLLGSVSYGGENYRVRSQAGISSAAELESYRLSSGDRLGDVVEVSLERPADRQVSKHNNATYYEAELTIAETASEVKIAKKVNKTLQDLYENRQTDWEYYPIWDSSAFIGQAVNELVKNIIIGSIVAAVILLLVFKSFRTMLIIGVSIPICILTTFLAMKLFNFSINIITLMGLGIGTGMIVDACIVVLENIFRKLQAGEKRLEAVLNGTAEVRGPVASSILTTIAVFVPISFLEGMVGEMMKQMAITISISLIASFLVAMVLIPVLAMFWAERKEPETGQTRGIAFYERLLHFFLARKKRVIIGFVLTLGLALFLLIAFVPKNYLPDVSERALYVRYQIEEKTDFDFAKKMMEEVAGRVLAVEGVQDVIYWSSENNSHTAGFYVHYLPVKEMTRSDEDVNAEIAEIFADTVPYSFISIGSGQSDTAGKLSLSLTSDSMGSLLRESPHIQEELQLLPGVTGVESDVLQGSEEWIIDFSPEQLAYYGLRRSEVERYLSLVMRGEPELTLRIDGEEKKASLVFPEIYRKSSDAFYLLPLVENQRVTVDDVAGLTLQPAEQNRLRQNESYHSNLTVFYQPENRDELLNLVGTLIENKKGGEVQISFAGREQDQQEAFVNLGIAMAVSFAAVFLILTVQFNRLAQPFLIMLSLPFAMIGVSIGFLTTGRTFDAVATIGVIMLIGIVVNNAIVLIDFINKNRNSYSTLRAAIVEAAKIRLRPNLTTTVTTIGGLFPLFVGGTSTSNFQTPIATAVLFGLFFSTAVSLLFLPVLYEIFESRKEKKKIRDKKGALET